MSKCRYDLSEDCNNKDCVKCILDKVRAEIEAYQSDAFYPDNVMMSKRMVLEIIDKYRKGE